MTDTLTIQQRFFYDQAPYSWAPGKETPEQGRIRTARELARAEDWLNTYAVIRWELESDPEWGDFDAPNYPQYRVALVREGQYAEDDETLASLGCVDLGPDVGNPLDHPYVRVVAAELAYGLMTADTMPCGCEEGMHYCE